MPLPTRFIVLALLPLLAVFPPETRGESMVGCALLVGLLALVQWRSGSGRMGPHALLVAVALTAATLASLATVPAAAVEPLAIGLLAAAAGLAAVGSVEGERFARAAVVVLAVAAVCVALHALYQWLWGLERLAEIVREDAALPDRETVLTRLGRGRAFAAFATPAALGGFLAMTLPATVGLAFSERGRARWAWMAAATVGAAAFLAAASATAAAALLAAVAFGALCWNQRRRVMVAGALALLVLLAGVIGIRGTRLVNLDDPQGPWRLRAGNFRAAATMAGDHPWSGVGPGGFAELYPVYRRAGDNETRHAHDLPLELVAEWGLPAGTLLAALFFVLFLQPLWRERGEGPPWRRGLAVGLAAFALQNLADFTALMPSLLWTAALLRGAIARPSAETGAGESRGSLRVLVGCSLATVLLAAGLAASSGLAANARAAARGAGFAGDPERTLLLAERAARLAPWDVDGAVLLARATTDVALRAPSDETAMRQALDRCNRAVRLSPVRASARQIRARVRVATRDLPGAFADLGEAARLHPVRAGYAIERDRLRDRLAAEARAVTP